MRGMRHPQNLPTPPRGASPNPWRARATPARTAEAAGTAARWPRAGEVVELQAAPPLAARVLAHAAREPGALLLSRLQLEPARPLIAAVAAPAWVQGADAAIVYHRAAAACEAAGLGAWLAEPLEALDPVARGLAVVAAALTCRPALLLADRPDAGLPEATVQHLRAAFDHAAVHGSAVLFTAAGPALAQVARRRLVWPSGGEQP